MHKKYSFVFIIMSALIWALDGIILTPKYFMLGFYDVNFIVFISHFIPLLILTIFLRKNINKINKNDFIYYILVALFGGVIGTLSIVKALMLSEFSLSLVTLIQKIQPIFAVMLAYIILKERPSKKFYIVLLISLVSLYFLIFGLNSPKLLDKNNLLASFYSLIVAISFGSSTVFSKRVSKNSTFLTAIFYRYLFTSIIMSIILLASKDSFASIKIYISNPDLYKLTIIIALFSLLSLSMYYKGIKSTKAYLATVSELAFPLGSVIIEGIVYKRILSPIQLISSLVLVSSILYLNLDNKK